MVFAEIWKTVPISVPVCILRPQRIKAPIVASGERGSDPTAVLEFPPIGHAIAVGICIGRVGCDVNVGHGKVSRIGRTACSIIANVDQLDGVVAPKRGLFEEEAEVFSTVAHPVAVGIANTGIGRIVPLWGEFCVAELVKIGP